MKLALRLALLGVVLTGCGGGPAAPSVPDAVTFVSGEIVFRGPAISGQYQLVFNVGAGPIDDVGFECHAFAPSASGDWRCDLGTQLKTNFDYWIYVVAYYKTDAGDRSTTPGLLNGEVWIRGQRVTRTTGVLQPYARPPTTWTAAAFRIIDGNGTIQ